MKNITIAVEYQDPVKTLKQTLMQEGAHNINLHFTSDGALSVRYEIKVTDPQKVIAQLVEKSGGKLLRFAPSVRGADFDFRIDDRWDEKAFKAQMLTQINAAGYRAN